METISPPLRDASARALRPERPLFVIAAAIGAAA